MCYIDDMYTIFTDGSCDYNVRGSKNIGGYAYVIINEHGIKINEFVGKETCTTNNRMELMAVISALEKLKNINEQIVINSDSQYVVNAINQKWIHNWKKWISKKVNLRKKYLILIYGLDYLIC